MGLLLDPLELPSDVCYLLAQLVRRLSQSPGLAYHSPLSVDSLFRLGNFRLRIGNFLS